MPSSQATFCKKCSRSPPLNRPDRAAAPRHGPRIETLAPPHVPRTQCAPHSSRTSAASRVDAATLRPFQPAPRRKPRLRVRSRMGTRDAADRSNQAAPPLLRRLPHARRQHRQAPAGNGAESTAGRSVLPPKSLTTMAFSIIMARSDRSDLRMTGRMTGARAHCVATLTEQSAGSSAQRSALKKGFLSWPATR